MNCPSTVTAWNPAEKAPFRKDKTISSWSQSPLISIVCSAGFSQFLPSWSQWTFGFKIPSLKSQRRQWHPTPVLLPGKSHGRRSLVGCSPWVREESETTERLHFHFSLSCFGEENGNPLQCSCLENPRDRGAWWAALYGVTQSWTRLNHLCRSSSTVPQQRIFSNEKKLRSRWKELSCSSNVTRGTWHAGARSGERKKTERVSEQKQ